MMGMLSILLFGFYVIFLQEVITEVVISPVNLTVIENQAATLTCTLTGTTEAAKYFSWFYKRSSEPSAVSVGILTSTCTSVVTPINTSLYEYACPSNTQSTWTIKKVTRQNHGDRYQCNIETSSGNENSENAFVQVQDPVVQHFYIEEHRSQTSVTVDEHDDEVEFKCFVDSNTASYTTIIFEGDVIKEGVNATSISVVLRDISCYDAGVYICEGRTYGGQISRRNITLLVNCSPRPRRQVEGNVTTELHSSLTLSFSAIAYPEPGPKGFAWYKEAGVGWFPLLSNEDLRISSSGLQSNLTPLNVSRGDYGHYKVIVTNIIATYVQHLFMFEKMDHREIVKENECKKTDNTTLVLGLILGTVCCVLAIYATYLTIWKKRHLNIGRKPPGSSTNKSTYANTSIDSDAVKRQECESVKTQNQESYAHQYSDLSLYTNTDRNTYDVINKT